MHQGQGATPLVACITTKVRGTSLLFRFSSPSSPFFVGGVWSGGWCARVWLWQHQCTVARGLAAREGRVPYAQHPPSQLRWMVAGTTNWAMVGNVVIDTPAWLQGCRYPDGWIVSAPLFVPSICLGATTPPQLVPASEYGTAPTKLKKDYTHTHTEPIGFCGDPMYFRTSVLNEAFQFAVCSAPSLLCHRRLQGYMNYSNNMIACDKKAPHAGAGCSTSGNVESVCPLVNDQFYPSRAALPAAAKAVIASAGPRPHRS
jgi:hypothetical protein